MYHHHQGGGEEAIRQIRSITLIKPDMAHYSHLGSCLLQLVHEQPNV